MDTLASDLDALIRHLDRPNLSVVTLSFGGCVLARCACLDGCALSQPTSPSCAA
ncbi:hypothetical protein [Tunturiibacter gelidoferens]|uniref:hypothetical protein n=1 Tax=Tunturiibacter gelidiferens TaxID=3069689 RepID=UPI003872F7F0